MMHQFKCDFYEIKDNVMPKLVYVDSPNNSKVCLLSVKLYNKIDYKHMNNKSLEDCKKIFKILINKEKMLIKLLLTLQRIDERIKTETINLNELQQLRATVLNVYDKNSKKLSIELYSVKKKLC